MSNTEVDKYTSFDYEQAIENTSELNTTTTITPLLPDADFERAISGEEFLRLTLEKLKSDIEKLENLK